jgi:hypothetical protein
MFGFAILDVALGLIFVSLLLSLIYSAANELIEMVLKKRAMDLEKGISELIGDPNNETKFINAIYNHGLVNGLFRGDYGTTDKSKLPSISQRETSRSLSSMYRAHWLHPWALATPISSSSSATSNPTTIPAISSLIPNNVKTAFATLQKTAGTDAEKLQESVEDWYNSAMDRVSGWYKRRTQILISVLGFAIAIAMNVDCIRIAKRLTARRLLRAAHTFACSRRMSYRHTLVSSGWMLQQEHEAGARLCFLWKADTADLKDGPISRIEN